MVFNLITSWYGHAFELLMMNEGIEANDPFDVGGHTIFGITEKFHKEKFAEVYALFQIGLTDEAKQSAELFYYSEYWNTLYDYLKDSSLAFRLFDFGVNAGRKKAVRLFQRTINKFNKKNRFTGLKPDGIFGGKTLATTNELEPYLLYELYRKRLEKFYRTRSTFWRFGKGWLIRLSRRKILKLRLKENPSLIKR